jgi:hypothetical protein
MEKCADRRKMQVGLHATHAYTQQGQGQGQGQGPGARVGAVSSSAQQMDST